MPAPRTRSVREAEKRKELVEKAINHLVSMPKIANTTVTTKTFRAMLLQTDGWLMAHGKMYDIIGKSLGAGVYRVSLKERT